MYTAAEKDEARRLAERLAADQPHSVLPQRSLVAETNPNTTRRGRREALRKLHQQLNDPAVPAADKQALAHSIARLMPPPPRRLWQSPGPMPTTPTQPVVTPDTGATAGA